MPIRHYLSGKAFDPDEFRWLSDAFTSICTHLRLVDRDDPATRLIAERIIAHAHRWRIVRPYRMNSDVG